jgi:hypothetical protein
VLGSLDAADQEVVLVVQGAPASFKLNWERGQGEVDVALMSWETAPGVKEVDTAVLGETGTQGWTHPLLTEI